MTDHRAFVAALEPTQKIELTEKSNRAGLFALGGHVAVILLVGIGIFIGGPLTPLLILLQGILLVFLFTAMHECVHRTAFQSRQLNDWVAKSCGFILVLPCEWFRLFHFAHHRHTQDQEKDPELARPKPETVGQYVWHVSGLPVWYQQLLTLFRNAAGQCEDDFVPSSARSKIAREARGMIAGYALLFLLSAAAGSTVLLEIWVLPLLVGQPFLRLYLLAEHGRCPFVADMFSNSRTTFTNALMRRLAWNMPYHAEHHALPSVPFHRLPEFHHLTRGELKVTESGYTRFNRDYIAHLGE